MFIIFAERVSPGAHGDGHLNISHIRAACRQPCRFRRHCSESDLHPSGQLFHKTAIVAIRSVGFDSVISKATKSYVTYYVSFVTTKSYVSYVPKYRCGRRCSSCWSCVNC